MRIYGLFNCTTKEKAIHRMRNITDTGRLPCGVYRILLNIPLMCKECDGTGGEEEVSGGHKKECEACSGSGLDPVKLREFEELPTISSRNFGGAWVSHRHDRPCKKCDDCWREYCIATRPSY